MCLGPFSNMTSIDVNAEQHMKPRNEALGGLVERQNQSTWAHVKERGVSGNKIADWDREGEQEGVSETRKKGGKGLALLKDREGQITNNETERQERREGGEGWRGGRDGGEKRGKENMLSEGRREWKSQ